MRGNISRMQKVLNQLYSLSNQSLKTFAEGLIPNAKPMIGVKIPVLRKIAKEIANDNPLFFIENNDLSYYELELLEGMVIGYWKTDLMTKLTYIDCFINQIHDWSVCDSFCASLKIKKQDLATMWNFLLNHLESNHEFVKRFVVIMMMNHFLIDEYIEQVMEIINHLNSSEYYLQMGIAWLLATMMVKYPDKTLLYLEHHNLDQWTFQKALQKMLESYRVSDEIKIKIRNMKKQAKEIKNV